MSRVLARPALLAVAALSGAAALAQGVERPRPDRLVMGAPVTPAAPLTHTVQVPGGLLRVLGPATPSARVATAPAVSARTVTHVVDGVPVRVLVDQPPAATPGKASIQTTERTLPGGGIERLAVAATSARIAATPSAGTTAPATRRIVDVDQAGRTLDPADAERTDVLFRRVDRLPAAR